MSYQRHGGTGTRLYRIWKSMKCRCLDSSHPTYRWYGARGITVCAEWVDDFAAFRAWAESNGYADDLELDRIDVNGCYSPANCRWISHREQSLNRRDTLWADVDGERVLLMDLLNRHRIPKSSYFPHRRKGDGDRWLSERIGRKVVVSGGKTHQEHRCV